MKEEKLMALLTNKAISKNNFKASEYKILIPPEQINQLKISFSSDKFFMYVPNLDTEKVTHIHGLDIALGYTDTVSWNIEDIFDIGGDPFLQRVYLTSGFHAYAAVNKYLERHRDVSKLVYSIKRVVRDISGKRFIIIHMSRPYRVHNNKVLANLNTCHIIKCFDDKVAYSFLPTIYREGNRGLIPIDQQTRNLREKIGADLLNYIGFASEELDILEYVLGGHSRAEIADLIPISIHTLKKCRVKSIKKKAGAKISAYFSEKNVRLIEIALYLREMHCI